MISSKLYSARISSSRYNLLERQFVTERRDLLEYERIRDRERDLTGRRREDRDVVIGERLAQPAGDDDRTDTAPARAHR